MPYCTADACSTPLEMYATVPTLLTRDRTNPAFCRVCSSPGSWPLVGVRDARTVFVGWVLFHVALNAASRTRPSAPPHLKRREGRDALAGFYGTSDADQWGRLLKRRSKYFWKHAASFSMVWRCLANVEVRCWVRHCTGKELKNSAARFEKELTPSVVRNLDIAIAALKELLVVLGPVETWGKRSVRFGRGKTIWLTW